MKIYFAADHAGFEIKNELMNFVRGELGHEVEDCGAYQLDTNDDYPSIIAVAARALVDDAHKGFQSRAIIAGGSGQGEAMAANRFRGVRCAVYYGEAARKQTDMSGKEIDILVSPREHQNANCLSLGLRFLTLDEAKSAVKKWLETEYPCEERHARRIEALDTLD
ncbi:MAG: RpiB/LacA/LacB family sugar-phosphate isomerase [Candidatus Paceibacterota bacterium]